MVMVGPGIVAPFSIVPLLLTNNEIRVERIILRRLSEEAFCTVRTIVAIFKIEMCFVRTANCIDEFQWRCRRCRSGAYIRTHSFFSKSHLTHNQILTIIYRCGQNFLQIGAIFAEQFANNI